MNRPGRTGSAAPAILAGLILLVTGAFDCVSAQEDARPMVAEAWRRMRGLETEREELTVLVVSGPDKPQYGRSDLPALTDAGRRGVARKRAVRSIRYSKDGGDKVHIAFVEPAEDRGTRYLVWRQPGAAQDDQWLYLPALSRVRRVPASGTQTFVGSNFTYEDIRSLSSEPLERFDYTLAGEDVVAGAPCTLVRATPREGTRSAYASRTIAFAKDSLFPMRVTLDGVDGKTWKVLFNVDPVEVSPGVWRPALAEMRDVRLGETTVIAFESREVNPTLAPAIFTQDSLARGTVE
jgi:outer membrane lipoprotein-sorting protein